jgi:hypothetical protein
MIKIKESFIREVFKQFSLGEVSFSKMTELINNEANSQSGERLAIATKAMEALLIREITASSSTLVKEAFIIADMMIQESNNTTD